MPYSVDVEVTTRCNLACKMCQHTYWQRPAIDMSLELFRQIIKDIPTLRSVKLHGIGEPFLNPMLFEMIRIAKSNELFIWTYSNGTLLKDSYIIDQLLFSGMNLLRISIDGATKTTYEAIRQKSSWDLVTQNVQRIVQRKKELGSSIQVELWMVGLKSNISEAKKFVELGAQLHVDAVRIQMVANSYDYNSEIGDKLRKDIISSGDDVLQYISQAQKRSQELNIIFEAASGKRFSPKNLCPWPTTRSFISAEGNIIPCGSIGNPHVISLGSLVNNSFSEIWEGCAYQLFRMKHKLSTIPQCCSRCYDFSNESNIEHV